MATEDGTAVDLAAVALQLIVYVRGAAPEGAAQTPFKRTHDFAIFAVDSVPEALDVGLLAAAEGRSAGVGLGDVLVEGDDRFGTPVVIAARLAGVARDGEVLCDPLIASFAPDLRFVEAGTHSLKGIDEPMVAVRPVDGPE